MENLVTIIYYTANVEDEAFEKKIRDNILEKTDLPIISVSRKPIDFGQNICIGEQPVCYSNLWKQQLIGLKAAKTEFCITAESDCLYPPEYFTFVPPRKDLVYRYADIYVYWRRKPQFWRKHRCEGAQICGREYWIERLEAMINGHQGWEPMPEDTRKLVGSIFPTDDRFTWGGNPVISFKTGAGISGKTALTKDRPVKELPYWGDINLIHNKMFV
jgi:hypothetical protein